MIQNLCENLLYLWTRKDLETTLFRRLNAVWQLFFSFLNFTFDSSNWITLYMYTVVKRESSRHSKYCASIITEKHNVVTNFFGGGLQENLFLIFKFLFPVLPCIVYILFFYFVEYL